MKILKKYFSLKVPVLVNNKFKHKKEKGAQHMLASVHTHERKKKTFFDDYKARAGSSAQTEKQIL